MEGINQLVALLQSQTEKKSNQIAYTFLLDGENQEQHWTYADLYRQTCMIAAAIQGLGIPPNERALLLYQPGLDYIAAFFGCLFAGVIAIPAYLPYNRETTSKIQHIIDNAKPKLCLTTKTIRTQLKKMGLINWLNRRPLLNVITAKLAKKTLDNAVHLAKCRLDQLQWLTTDTLAKHLADDWKPLLIKPEQLAFLQYTSGSTGYPKGVMVTHKNLLHNLHILKQCGGLKDSAEFVGWLPPYHDMGLIGLILMSVYNGSPARLMSPIAFLQRPARWLQAISKYRAISSAGPNFAYDLCVNKITAEEKEKLDLSCWENTAIGAEPIRASTIKRFIETFSPYGFKANTFFPCYGLAEATLIATGETTPASRQMRVAIISNEALQNNQIKYTTENDKDKLHLIGSGPSIQNQNLLIVNPETNVACKQNQIGEIWITGPSVTQGYWQQPKLTEQIFNAHLNTGEGPYLRTGDLGFLKENELFVTGRLKDLIIIHGRNHYPQDIEYTVEQSHPGLRPGCCAAFAYDYDEQEKLVIVQEIRSHQTENHAEIATVIRNRVFKHHGINPHCILLVAAKTLSKTTSGKIRRQACKQSFLAKQLSIVYTDQPSSTISDQPPVKSSSLSSSFDSLDNFISQVAHITQQPSSEINPNLRLSELGIDSLTLFELQWLTEKQSEAKITIEFLLTDPTVKELYAEMNNNQPVVSVFSRSQPIDWDKEFEDCKYTPSIMQAAAPQAMQSVLLTGATGFLGAYLVKEMLEQTQYIIYCVVKATDNANGLRRIKNNLHAYGLWKDHYASRIKAVLGDLTLANLGFDELTYADLSARIDVIYHNAAALNFVYPYYKLKQTNVIGTREILRFATANKLKPVHYLSTIGYFLSADVPNTQEITEETALAPQQGIYGGYNQTKWMAENLVRHASANGIPTTIYRPGLIAGDSLTGYANIHDFISRMIKGFLQLAASPALDTEINLAPVDYVAKAIIYLSLKPDCGGETYHLTNPMPVHFKQLTSYLNKVSKKIIKSIPYKEWQHKLILHCKQDKNHPLYPLLPFFTETIPHKNLSMFELFTQPAIAPIRCDYTLKQLEGSQITCSSIDENIVQKYVACLDHTIRDAI